MVFPRSLSFLTLLGLGAAHIHAGGFITAPSYDVGPRPRSAVVGDFNGDGFPDVAVANTGNSGTVTILINTAVWP